MLKRVSFRDVRIEDSFWSPRIRTNGASTVKACIAKCMETGRVANFVNAGKLLRGEEHEPFQGLMYNDSDVYKVLEGAAYTLHTYPSEELKQQVNAIIDAIASAQHPDGYINTYFTLARPDGRWTDMGYHEMYCIGHLIEAGIAYFESTGDRKLLDMGIRAAEHIYQNIYEKQIHWIPGHQEIELALLKLYFLTGEEKYRTLSQYLVEQRGHGYPFLDIISPCVDEMGGRKYNQDGVPAEALSHISGHAVRAMYYYCAITELAALNGRTDYTAAMERVYGSMLRNMYITGGIGQSRHNEGFTEDYDLPNDCYCETCAGVGVVYWTSRMNRLLEKAEYMDVAEMAMFNGAISGVSLDGEKFFYVNPLVSNGNHHRQPWHKTSCCPTQISRFIPSVADYVYATDDAGTVYVNMYMQSQGDFECGSQRIRLSQKTDYPYSSRIVVSLENSLTSPITLKLRIPGWCKSFLARFNGLPMETLQTQNGYLIVDGLSQAGDQVELDLEMPVRLVRADNRVESDRDKVAVMVGPVVYCMEQTDNGDLTQYSLDDSSRFVKIQLPQLPGIQALQEVNTKGVFVPYFAWDNREAGAMGVWIPYHKKRDWLYE